jgi:ArsR family transcriptional regulator
MELVDSERRGLWAYYCALPERLEELTSWLS